MRVQSSISRAAWLCQSKADDNFITNLAISTLAAMRQDWDDKREEGRESIALLALALVGAVLGFLPFKSPPARIFTGTAGALIRAGHRT